MINHKVIDSLHKLGIRTIQKREVISYEFGDATEFSGDYNEGIKISVVVGKITNAIRFQVLEKKNEGVEEFILFNPLNEPNEVEMKSTSKYNILMERTHPEREYNPIIKNVFAFNVENAKKEYRNLADNFFKEVID